MNDRLLASARSGWIPIIGCMVVMMIVSGLSMIGLGVIAPEWIRVFSLSTGEVMLVLTGISVMTGILGIGVGLLSARFPPRTLLLAGVIIGALALFLASRATSYTMLLLTMVPLAAAANALTGPVVGQNLAVRSFEKPGLAIAVVSMGMSFGAILGPMTLATMMVAGDWRSALASAAMIVAVLGVGAVLVMIRNPARTGAATAQPIATPEPSETVTTSDVAIVASPAFIGAVLFQFPLMALMAGSFFHLTLYYGELGASLGDAARLMSTAALFGLVGTFVAGWLVDRVPLILLQTTTFAIMAAGHLLLAFRPETTTLAIGIVMMSLGNSFLFPLIPAILSRRFAPADFSRALGFNQPFLFSAILGALIIGVVHDRFGNYPATYQALLPALPVALLGMLLLWIGGRRGQ